VTTGECYAFSALPVVHRLGLKIAKDENRLQAKQKHLELSATAVRVCVRESEREGARVCVCMWINENKTRDRSPPTNCHPAEVIIPTRIGGTASH